MLGQNWAMARPDFLQNMIELLCIQGQPINTQCPTRYLVSFAANPILLRMSLQVSIFSRQKSTQGIAMAVGGAAPR
jgi:hypothetical protein